MKKTFKTLATAALSAIAISSVLLLSAAAEDAAKPSIKSANISYEGDYAILLAVDAATVSGGSVSVQIWDEAGTDLGKYSASATEKIDALGGKDFYVVKTAGIAQKDMGKEFTYQATDANGNVGDKAKISVAEYFYTRLFVNGIADATEGADLARKNLYLTTLAGGAFAQDLFYNYNEDSADDINVFVDDLLYANIPGYDFAGYETTLLENNTTKVTLPGAGSYNVTKYAKDTLAKTVTTVEAGTEITIDAHTVVTAGTPVTPEIPAFVAGAGEYYNNKDISGTRFDFTTTANLDTGAHEQWGPIVPPDTLSIADGSLVITRKITDGVTESYIKFIHGGFKGTENAPVFVYETDFMFDGYVANQPEDGRIGRFDFRLGGTKMIEIPITADFTAGEPIDTVKFGILELTAGTWYNIRFAFDVSTDEITFYCNGVKVGSEVYASKANTNTARNWSCWYLEKELTAGAIHFDNTIMACTDANPPAPVEGGSFYNNADITGTRIDGNDLVDKFNVKPTDTATAVVDDEGKLVFTNVGGGYNSFSWNHTAAEGLETPVMVIEADMSLSMEGSGRVGYVKIRGNGKEIVLNVQFWQNTVYISFNGSKGVQLVKGEEANLRMEIDYANATINYYVDDVLKKTETDLTFADSTSNAVVFEFSSSSTTGSVMTFDNVFIGTVEDGTAK